MKLGTQFKVDRLTSVYVSRYATKNSALIVARYLFLGFFWCRNEQDLVKKHSWSAVEFGGAL